MDDRNVKRGTYLAIRSADIGEDKIKGYMPWHDWTIGVVAQVGDSVFQVICLGTYRVDGNGYRDLDANRWTKKPVTGTYNVREQWCITLGNLVEPDSDGKDRTVVVLPPELALKTLLQMAGSDRGYVEPLWEGM